MWFHVPTAVENRVHMSKSPVKKSGGWLRIWGPSPPVIEDYFWDFKDYFHISGKKNRADSCASKVNISAFCRFMKLPIILLSQNLMHGTVKLRYSLWKCNQKPRTCNNTPFILKSMDIAYFPRSKTPISQVADIITENSQKFWKIWEKFYQPRSIWLHWCILGHRNASLLFSAQILKEILKDLQRPRGNAKRPRNHKIWVDSFKLD